MRKNLTRKKKKAVMPVKDKKTVRIDERTVIEVSVDIPDEVARERFLVRHGREYQAPTTYMSTRPRAEVPSGSLEELSAMVDDSELPDED